MHEDAKAVLQSEPQMDALVSTHGPVTVEPASDQFRRFVVSIINQSISTAAASSIRADFFDLFEQPLSPEAVLQAAPEDLAAVLGAQKAEYVQNGARRFSQEDLSAEALAEYSDREVVETLTEIRGVGEWTAEMYLLFGLGREDVFPVGDLAVRRGMETLYGELTRERMIEKARDWQPYRSYATKYLWAEYESE